MMGVDKWLRNLRWLMKLKLEYPNKGGQKEFMVQEWNGTCFEQKLEQRNLLTPLPVF